MCVWSTYLVGRYLVFRLHEVPSSGNDPERQGTGEGRVVYMYRAQGRNQKRRNKFPRGNKADLAPKPSAIRGVKKKKRFKKKKKQNFSTWKVGQGPAPTVGGLRSAGVPSVHPSVR